MVAKQRPATGIGQGTRKLVLFSTALCALLISLGLIVGLSMLTAEDHAEAAGTPPPPAAAPTTSAVAIPGTRFESAAADGGEARRAGAERRATSATEPLAPAAAASPVASANPGQGAGALSAQEVFAREVALRRLDAGTPAGKLRRAQDQVD